VSGAYFVQTIFVEHWTIAESSHHLSRLAEPSITRNTRVSFGKGLDWDLDATRLVDSTDVVLIVKNRIYSNVDTIAQCVFPLLDVDFANTVDYEPIDAMISKFDAEMFMLMPSFWIR
jgi:hypothetical protein